MHSTKYLIYVNLEQKKLPKTQGIHLPNRDKLVETLEKIDMI